MNKQRMIAELESPDFGIVSTLPFREDKETLDYDEHPEIKRMRRAAYRSEAQIKAARAARHSLEDRNFMKFRGIDTDDL